MPFFSKINSLLDPTLRPSDGGLGQPGQQQPGQPQNQPLQVSAPITSSAPAADSSAPSQQMTKSTYFSPTAIVEANRGEKAMNITGDSSKAIATAGSALKEKADEYTSKVNSGYSDVNDGQVNSALTGDADAYKAVKERLTGAYKAPDAFHFDNTADGDVSYLASQEGRDSLMRKQGGASYTQGQLGLDRALSGYDSGYLDSIKSTQDASGQLNKDIGVKKAETGKLVEETGKKFDTNKGVVKKSIEAEQAKEDARLLALATAENAARGDLRRNSFNTANTKAAELGIDKVVDASQFYKVGADTKADDFVDDATAGRFNRISGLLNTSKVSTKGTVSGRDSFDSAGFTSANTVKKGEIDEAARRSQTPAQTVAVGQSLPEINYGNGAEIPQTALEKAVTKMKGQIQDGSAPSNYLPSMFNGPDAEGMAPVYYDFQQFKAGGGQGTFNQYRQSKGLKPV